MPQGNQREGNKICRQPEGIRDFLHPVRFRIDTQKHCTQSQVIGFQHQILTDQREIDRGIFRCVTGLLLPAGNNDHRSTGGTACIQGTGCQLLPESGIRHHIKLILAVITGCGGSHGRPQHLFDVFPGYGFGCVLTDGSSVENAVHDICLFSYRSHYTVAAAVASFASP